MSEQVNPGFRFSQSSLMAFEQCRRRFLLRYARRLEWPASLTTADQWEEAIRRGKLFHHWAQQDALGLDVEQGVRQSGDALLQSWWRHFRSQPPQNMPAGRSFAEIMLTVPLGEFRLLAKFDRVVLGEDGRAVIIDWKTGLKRPQQNAYAGSWQTLLYRYVLVEGGEVLNEGRSIPPEQVSLLYWHAQYPDLLKPISYSGEEHEEAKRLLKGAVEKIASLAGEEGFSKTPDLEECGRCEYRSYCERSVELRDRDDDWETDEEELDGELIPEAEL